MLLFTRGKSLEQTCRKKEKERERETCGKQLVRSARIRRPNSRTWNSPSLTARARVCGACGNGTIPTPGTWYPVRIRSQDNRYIPGRAIDCLRVHALFLSLFLLVSTTSTVDAKTRLEVLHDEEERRVPPLETAPLLSRENRKKPFSGRPRPREIESIRTDVRWNIAKQTKYPPYILYPHYTSRCGLEREVDENVEYKRSRFERSRDYEINARIIKKNG